MTKLLIAIVTMFTLVNCSSDPNSIVGPLSPFHISTTEELIEYGCYAPSKEFPICDRGQRY